MMGGIGSGRSGIGRGKVEACRFLDVNRRHATRRNDIANRPLIQEQAYGEALDPDKLERLGRYEVHLDRKLERTLAMLLKLKELRRTAEPR